VKGASKYTESIHRNHPNQPTKGKNPNKNPQGSTLKPTMSTHNTQSPKNKRSPHQTPKKKARKKMGERERDLTNKKEARKKN
jgi:hypothetical protein